MFKFTTAIVAAAAVVAVSGPAFAAEKQNAKVIHKDGKTYYCVKEQITGSLVPNRTCLTKEEWEAQGSKVASAKQDPVLASNPQDAHQN